MGYLDLYLTCQSHLVTGCVFVSDSNILGGKMDSVYKSLKDWLNNLLADPENGFPQSAFVIDVEQIPNLGQYQSAGLFSSSNDVSKQQIAGDYECTEFKSFYIRLPFNTSREREDNEVFKERLRDCINYQGMHNIGIRDGRSWMSICVNVGIHPAQMQGDNLWADYLVNLKIVYII